jgi:hypothetical protein
LITIHKSIPACLIAFGVALMPLGAVTVTQGGTTVPGAGMFSNISGATTINFDSGSAPTTGPIQYTYASTNILNGSDPGVSAAPFDDVTDYLSVGPTRGTPVTINFAVAADYFGFYATSVDDYNVINFYNGATLVLSLSGTDIGTLGGFDASGATSNFVYVNIFASNASEVFNQIVLSSTGNAFETDNHAFRAANGNTFDAPEPGTLMLLPAGLALVWMGTRRKKSSSL